MGTEDSESFREHASAFETCGDTVDRDLKPTEHRQRRTPRLSRAIRSCAVHAFAVIVASTFATAEGAHSATQQLTNVPVGSIVRIATAHGGTFTGEVVSKSSTTLEVRRGGQTAVEKIDCADVKTLKKIKGHPRRTRVVLALVAGALLSAVGAAVAQL